MAATSISALKTGNASQTAVATKEKTIFDFISGNAKIEKAIQAVANNFMTPDRYLRLAVNAVKKTPLLMQCDVQTVLGAFMTSAALGLEPNTPQQQAFLIPYKKRALVNGNWIDTYDCQFQIGYRGFITLAHRSPHIQSLQAESIHENDFFEYMLGTDSFLKYKKAMKNRGELIGAFAYSRLEGGTEISTVLPFDEIIKIRSKSETFNSLERKVIEADKEADKQKAQKKLDETPWVLWFDDMAAKSAIKKHAKQLPLAPGDAISAAVQLDQDSDDNIIDMASMADPDVVRKTLEDGFVSDPEVPPTSDRKDNERPQTIRPVTDNDQERPGRIQTQDVEDAVLTTPAADTPAAKLFQRISKATDIDVLDTDADLIKEMPEDEQEGLKLIYKARREYLENPQAATATPTRKTRPAMNLE